MQKRKNTSKYTGVYRVKRECKWCAQIQIKGKHIHLGYFNCEKEAAKAYQKALTQV